MAWWVVELGRRLIANYAIGFEVAQLVKAEMPGTNALVPGNIIEEVQIIGIWRWCGIGAQELNHGASRKKDNTVGSLTEQAP